MKKTLAALGLSLCFLGASPAAAEGLVFDFNGGVSFTNQTGYIGGVGARYTVPIIAGLSVGGTASLNMVLGSSNRAFDTNIGGDIKGYIPLMVAVEYAPGFASFGGVQPYVGIDGGVSLLGGQDFLTLSDSIDDKQIYVFKPSGFGRLGFRFGDSLTLGVAYGFPNIGATDDGVLLGQLGFIF